MVVEVKVGTVVVVEVEEVVVVGAAPSPLEPVRLRDLDLLDVLNCMTFTSLAPLLCVRIYLRWSLQIETLVTKTSYADR